MNKKNAICIVASRLSFQQLRFVELGITKEIVKAKFGGKEVKIVVRKGRKATFRFETSVQRVPFAVYAVSANDIFY